MDEQVQDKDLVSVAMQIILHAGDARIKTEEALQATKLFDFDLAHKKTDEAKECIRLAHQSQTEIIQDETRGITYPPSLLFNHAQDTLMTIMSELKLSTEIIELFEIINEKIK